jgi:hypothetical protein
MLHQWLPYHDDCVKASNLFLIDPAVITGYDLRAWYIYPLRALQTKRLKAKQVLTAPTRANSRANP